MLFTPRRIAAAAISAGGLILVTAPAAHAVVDPVHALTCLAETPADPTALLDPATVTSGELPVTHCLTP
ncbi:MULTISPECIES: hypothetical protein [unclassified Nonomuraea]|uniref:hypothetical protein n=1 Tax=unclassified Nonomuraea TaxID=2593643 RepID=UPI0035BEC003